MKHLVAVLFIVSVALLGGCKGGSREAALAGTWTSSQPGGGGALSLKEDKTFTIPIPGGGNISGKWGLEGDTVALRPEMFGPKTKAEALKELDDQAKKAPQFAPMVEPIKKMLNQMDLILAKGDKSGTISLQLGTQKQTVTYTHQEKK